jgi:ABC-2 type transport system permease protein
VQFLPAFVLPQLLLCGLFVPRAQMASGLRWLSDVMPLSYAVGAMSAVTEGSIGGIFIRDVVIVVGASAVALGLGAATLRRRTP